MARALRIVGIAKGTGILASVLLFGGTAYLGGRLLLEPARRFKTAQDFDDARAVSPFLESARRVVPQDDPVLVVTALVPAPDVDYWFGLRAPAESLVVVERDRVVRYVVNHERLAASTVPAQAELERLYDEQGRLLTRERLAEHSKSARWIVCTDPRSAERLFELEPDLKDRVALRDSTGVVVDARP